MPFLACAGVGTRLSCLTMVPVLEAVPNFSAGRDSFLLERLVRTAREAGAEVLDASADADHNRSVVTLAGVPRAVEEACVALAAVATEAIDLRSHTGAHPRVGALDVLPFVPLLGLDLADARRSARRVAERLVREVGLPVFFYAEASDPPGRALAELRKGGFEALTRRRDPARRPDLVPAALAPSGIHPSAGVTCVGARPLLLAWNVDVKGLTREALREVAATLRARDGGLAGVRALGLELSRQGRMQISMNLEDVRAHAPFHVFRVLETEVEARGGRVAATEVIGLIPDELVLGAGADRLSLLDPTPSRVLSSRVLEHVARRSRDAARAMLEEVDRAGDDVPPSVRAAAARLEEALIGPPVPDERE